MIVSRSGLALAITGELECHFAMPGRGRLAIRTMLGAFRFDGLGALAECLQLRPAEPGDLELGTLPRLLDPISKFDQILRQLRLVDRIQIVARLGLEELPEIDRAILPVLP